MGYFDADTHVDECDETWSYISERDRYLAPKTLEFGRDEIPSFLPTGYHRFWYIDGRLAPRRHRNDLRTATTLLTRELKDTAARLRDMDELGVDTQVIYPTLFLHEPSQRADMMAMLHRSYNRWLADRCAGSHGRLRWVAMIPFLSEREALAEIRFAKDHGAVGVFKLGIECGGRGVGDPLFSRFYSEIAEHDLALCVHQGTAWSPVNKFLSPFTQDHSGETPVYEAFAAMLRLRRAGQLPKDLRVGFVEVGAGWVSHRLSVSATVANAVDTLAECNFYVTCETFENLAEVIDAVGGDDHIVVGTDYTHGDRSSVIHAHRAVMERNDISPRTAQKITSQNARILYGT